MPDNDGNKGGRPVSLTSDMCLWVRKTAYACARRAGMTREECEDCAGDCLLRVLDLDEAGALRPQHLSNAWLFPCVDNYAKNAARTIRRRRIHEIALVYVEADSRLAITDTTMLPEPAAMRHELLLRLCIALSCLSAADLMLFQARCVDGVPVAEVAAAVNRTPGAFREAVRVLRQRLRLLLAREGLTGVEIAEYLQRIEASPPARPAIRRPDTE